MLNWTATIWAIAAAVAIKSLLVLGVAWLAALVLHKRSAASRHIVWTACAAALLALPLLSISVPVLRVPLAGAILPGDPGIVFRSTATALPSPSSAGVSAPAHRMNAAPPTAPRDWRTVILLVWAAGVAAGLVNMLYAFLLLRRMERAAQTYAGSRHAALLAHTMGVTSPVRVLETPAGMPMTFGLLRPTIFLPAAAATWSESRRRVVLLHELAHVRRGDPATHLIARTALVLHWWNPLAWMFWREFLHERERAADDLVLIAGAGQSEYAGHLLEVARSMQAAPATAAAAIAMARPSQLEGRLLAILSDGVNRRQPGRLALMIAAAVAIAVVLPLAAIRAQSTAAPAVPPDVDAVIRAATAQKNQRILEQAAQAYQDLHKYKEAQVLREAALSMREQESGKQSPQYAEGLVNLGLLFRTQGARQQSDEYYRQALALGDRPEVFSALLNLGIDAAGAPDRTTAYDYLRRARNVAANGNDMGRAMMWTAFLKSMEPEGTAEADSLYRGAMAAEEAGSAEQALTMEFYARFLKSNDRAAEAEPIAAHAVEIRKARAAALGPKRTLAYSAVKVGPGISPPRLLSKIEPSYSEDARAAKFQGTVKLQVVIDTDGTATDIHVIDSLGYGLDEKAVEAVTQWKFKPGEMNGAPIPVLATIEVNFRLM